MFSALIPRRFSLCTLMPHMHTASTVSVWPMVLKGGGGGGRGIICTGAREEQAANMAPQLRGSSTSKEGADERNESPFKKCEHLQCYTDRQGCCKREGCHGQTRVKCQMYEVNWCFIPNNNHFSDFHTN